jgi:uncharacterized protein (DUF1778 family)
MASRAALLINCSAEEALTIRERAKVEHRGISSYMLNIVMRSVDFEEKLRAGARRFQALKRSLSGTPIRSTGPRTTLLLRCSTEESERIRRVAEMEDTTICGFVLHCLKRSWDARTWYAASQNL